MESEKRNPASNPSVPGPVERRLGGDRRSWGKSNLRFLFCGGRRTAGRRFEDRQRILYLDRYRQLHFGVIVLILLLSLMDALLTLFLVNHGAVELNPIMAFYLDIGPYTFLLVKYGLTCAGVIILLFVSSSFLQSLRVRADVMFYLALAAFLGVITWEIYLIHRVFA